MRDIGHLMGQGQSLSSLFYAALGIAVVATVLSLLWLLIYKRMHKHHDRPAAADFTLEELQKLYQQGHLNDDEFRTARSRIIEKVN